MAFVYKHRGTDHGGASGDSASVLPLLDYNVQSDAHGGSSLADTDLASQPQSRSFTDLASPWSKQQKRLYHRLQSWQKEAQGRCCQLLRIDLTTASGAEAAKLRRHKEELRRRIKRVFSIDLDLFAIETNEGNGVLHCIAAIDQQKAAWIPHDWLSAQWQDIHGAPIASIKRMGTSKGDLRRVARYMVSQYLVQQGIRGSALVRYSWSWWRCRVAIGRGWAQLKRHRRFAQFRIDRSMRRGELLEPGQKYYLTWNDLLSAWDSLLFTGACVLGDVMLVVEDRQVKEFGRVASVNAG